MKFLKVVSFIFLFIPSIGFSQIVVISDIDDTIKISHVLDRWDKIKNAFKTDPFWQMSELYRSISTGDVQFFYVSNAPEELMENQHEKFLKRNKFPSGYLVLPELDERNEHKIRNIRKILKSTQPAAVIFIGDNGEKDAEIYYQMTEEHKNSGIDFVTYIRMDYDYSQEGSRLAPGQKSFVSAGELALYFWELGLLSFERARLLVKNSLVTSLELPDWVDCSKHKTDIGRFFLVGQDVLKKSAAKIDIS
jgi:hypothetical protein